MRLPVLLQHIRRVPIGAANLVILLTAIVTGNAAAQTATSVSLSLSSSSVLAGTSSTLTATVSPSQRGTVTFCDASASDCIGVHKFGTVATTTTGTATLRKVFGVGSYHIQAVLAAGAAYAGSTSPTQALTVAGNANYLSSTAITASGVPGNYLLTGTVKASGLALPTGDVSFIDTTASNLVIATQALNPASSVFGFTNYPNVTATTYGAVIGDFNEDGIPDYAVVNVNVDVGLGVGNGAFSAPVSYTGVDQGKEIETFDLNGDGHLDLVILGVNSSSGYVSNVGVLLGNGDGTFQAVSSFPSGHLGTTLAIADLNRDGYPDIAVVNSADNQLAVFLGNGNGTFQAKVAYTVSPSNYLLYDIVIADFNRDGKLDVLIGDAFNYNLLLGNGDGTFASSVVIPLPTNSFPTRTLVGDFNRDGKLDLASSGFGNASLIVNLGNGDGTFQAGVLYGATSDPQVITVGDFNGDGFEDLAIGSSSSQGVFFLGNGDGTFQAAETLNAGSGHEGIVAADLDGDGLDDLFVSQPSSTDWVLLAQHTLTAVASGAAVPGPGTQQVKASYPGDATHEASLSSATPLLPQSSTTTLSALPLSSVSGTAVTLIATITPTPGGTGTGGTVSFYTGSTLLGTANVSGNTASLPLAPPASGYTPLKAVYSGNPVLNGSTSTILQYFVGPQTALALAVAPASAAAGTPIMLIASATLVSDHSALTTGVVTFNYQQTVNGQTFTGTFGTVPVTVGSATMSINPGAGSFIVTASLAGQSNLGPAVAGPLTVTFTGNAAYASTTTLVSSGTTGDYTLAAGVTAFGLAAPSGSMTFQNTSNANATVATANLDPTTLAYSTVAAGTSPVSNASVAMVITGDFNVDGYTDIATATSSGKVKVLLGAGNGTFQAPVTYHVTGSLNGIVSADVNNDGKVDLIVFSYNNSLISILLGNGDGTFQTPSGPRILNLGGGHTPTSIAIGDFNHDGNTDIVELDNNYFLVGVFLGRGDGTFQSVAYYNCQYSATSLTVGDFNGDGNLDIAVDYQYNSYVTILYGTAAGTFGTSTTVNLPRNDSTGFMAAGSFNGNGITDLVVPDNASSYIFIYPGTGSALGSPVTISSANPPGTVFLADVDHDGKLDMLVTYYAEVGFFHGNGDGTFAAEQDFPTGNGVGNVTTGDFNNDGIPDLVTSNTSDGTGTLLLGLQTVSATATAVYVTGSGAQLVQASFPGDALRTPSVSPTVSLTPSAQAASSTALATSAAAVHVGDSVTFTATVSPAPTGAAFGTITFLNGSTVLATMPATQTGVAAYTTTTLLQGTASITAIYSGNSGLTTSTSAVLSEMVTLPTTTVVSASAATLHAGQSVTFTATVSPVPTGSPLGIVSFFSGSTLLTTVPLNSSGVAILNTTSLPAGTDLVTAVYTGNALFDTSTSAALSEMVTLPTTTIVSASAVSLNAGQNVTLTATVSPVPTGSPLGTVSFFNGSTLLTTVPVNSSGVAILSTTSLPAGADLVTAVYTGNALFDTSTSTGINLTVRVATTTTLSSGGPATISLNQAVTLTATVAPAPSGSTLGTVNFFSGTTQLGTGPVNNSGLASLTTAALAAGMDAVSAVYSGNAASAGSTSSPLNFTVNSSTTQAATTVTISASPTTQVATQPVVLAAKVASVSAGDLSGTVTFLTGTSVITIVSVGANGQVSYPATTLPDGMQTITATYSGNASFLPSASTGSATIVTVADLNLALGGDNNKTVAPGAAVTYNFPLSPVVTPTFIYEVHLTASGLPPGATYTFNPATLPAGSGTSPVALTIQTAANGQGKNSMPFAPIGRSVGLVLAMVLPLFGSKAVRKKLHALPCIMLFLMGLGAVGLAGCGAGGLFGQPPNTYTINVLANSGGLVRTSTVQLNVQ